MDAPALRDSIGTYLAQVRAVLDAAPEAEIAHVIELLLAANRHQRTLFVMGNGGSAATASHFACDLGKGAIVYGSPRFRVIALTDNVPLMTAWANDTDYSNIFVEQLLGLVAPGDVVLGISGSGNSPNVLRAIEAAREVGAVTVGMTGFDGGALRRMVDLSLHIPCSCMEQVEDVHMVLCHLIATRVREALRAEMATQRALGVRLPVADHRRVQALVDRLTRALDVTIASLFLVDEEGQILVGQAISPIRQGTAAPPVGRQIPLGLAPGHRRALRVGEPVRFGDGNGDGSRAVSVDELRLALTSEITSGALLPLKTGAGIVGVVAVGEERAWARSPFTDEKLARGLTLVSEMAETLGAWYNEGKQSA